MHAAARQCPRCGRKLEALASFCPDDGSALVEAPDPRIGSVVAGHILLTAVAGEGASGRVYRGRQQGTDRDVAVKVLRPELSNHPEVVKRFEREARIASQLQHPHVVEVFLAGKLDDHALYIVMEYLDGVSLGAALEKDKTFGLDRAIAVTLQICEAVGQAHARGVVHRDLKPENVVLLPNRATPDWVKVVDFGIATSSLGGLSTAAGRVFGTPRYISPEAAWGGEVTPASDVYAIATMLYEMLCGQAPFDAEDGIALLVKQIHEPPIDLRSTEHGRGVPEAVARVIMQNLAKDASERAPDAQVLARALTAAASSAVEGSTLVGTARSSIGRSSVPAPRAASRGVALAVILAILSGLAMTGAIEGVLRHADHERAGIVTAARDALAQGRADDVDDAISAGLVKWPGDPTLLQLRVDAAHDLINQAMTARASGDVETASNAAHDALQIAPDDKTAKSLADQYDRELATPAVPSGAPRVLFRVTPPARPRAPITIAARVVARPTTPITSMKVTVFEEGKSEGAEVPPSATPEGGIFETTIRPGHGRRRIVFEAMVGTRLVRAERTIELP